MCQPKKIFLVLKTRLNRHEDWDCSIFQSYPNRTKENKKVYASAPKTLHTQQTKRFDIFLWDR